MFSRQVSVSDVKCISVLGKEIDSEFPFYSLILSSATFWNFQKHYLLIIHWIDAGCRTTSICTSTRVVIVHLSPSYKEKLLYTAMNDDYICLRHECLKAQP